MQQTLISQKGPSALPQPAAVAGVSSEQARQLLAEHGFNEPVARRHSGLILQFLHFFANPLVIILLIAAGISAPSGDPINAAIIVIVVLLSVSLNFVQTSLSQHAAEQLRK
ncbi:MAG: magnesium-translocating P-type ATPase, partial [Acidobacteria bacterium]|nr:magnesium-translocating P-type ATPase [Acidobacteriota bacterium]